MTEVRSEKTVKVRKTTSVGLFFLTLGILLFTLGFPVNAQQARVPQIGFLDEGSISRRAHRDPSAGVVELALKEAQGGG